MDKNFYNEASASKLGWKPDWFGAKYFDEDLVENIKEWQRKNKLTADGLCGPSTHRRIYNERIANLEEHKPFKQVKKDESFIVMQGNFHKIEWPNVILWNESGGLKLSGGYTPYFQRRDINNFVNHWDVCLSAETCVRVLNKRGISVHFCIDNDGTIYQLTDMNNACWHAGSKKWNHNSVGVEISNAYYTKYQSWYKRNGYGERPLVTGASVHGSNMDDFLDFYPVQIEALKALWNAVHKSLDIPLKCPLDKNGETLGKVSTSAAAGRFKGFISHYHLTRRKIDCAGLDINKLLKEIK